MQQHSTFGGSLEKSFWDRFKRQDINLQFRNPDDRHCIAILVLWLTGRRVTCFVPCTVFNCSEPRKGLKGPAKVLISKGAEVNKPNNEGKSPLHEAASHGHEKVVELLLDKGAEVNGRDREGATPLHYATQSFIQSQLAICYLLFSFLPV